MPQTLKAIKYNKYFLRLTRRNVCVLTLILKMDYVKEVLWACLLGTCMDIFQRVQVGLVNCKRHLPHSSLRESLQITARVASDLLTDFPKWPDSVLARCGYPWIDLSLIWTCDLRETSRFFSNLVQLGSRSARYLRSDESSQLYNVTSKKHSFWIVLKNFHLKRLTLLI